MAEAATIGFRSLDGLLLSQRRGRAVVVPSRACGLCPMWP